MGLEATLGDLPERYGDQPVEAPTLLRLALLQRDVCELLQAVQRPPDQSDGRALPKPDHRPRLVPQQLLESIAGSTHRTHIDGLGHAGNATRPS
jgi:hypothetical protein